LAWQARQCLLCQCEAGSGLVRQGVFFERALGLHVMSFYNRP
jgi:hypothetical protein